MAKLIQKVKVKCVISQEPISFYDHEKGALMIKNLKTVEMIPVFDESRKNSKTHNNCPYLFKLEFSDSVQNIFIPGKEFSIEITEA